MHNAAPRASSTSSAAFAVAVLTGMNLLNYIDRWVPSAVKELFKKDLGLTDAQTSLPLSAFVIVYMVASPIFGTLADKGRRPVLIAIGVAVWSLATAGAGLAQGFMSLLLFRALVGIGEAAYATIAPAMLADLFPVDKRNRIFTLFYVAIPVGSAIGFTLGGFLGQQWGWRAAFLAVGLPGLLVAGLALLIKDPPRGAFDDKKDAHEPPPWPEALRLLAKNRRYVFTVAGYIANTFAIGGIADWFPTFLHREHGFGLDEAGGVAGVAVVVGGLLGTLAGGFLGDALKTRVKEPYLFVCGASMLPALALAGVSIYVVESKTAVLFALMGCQFFLWMFNAPVNALLVNSVVASIRARAFGLSLLLIHLLGDVLSPPLIGLVSDQTGSLTTAISLVLLALLVAAVVWLWGAFSRLDQSTPPRPTGAESGERAAPG